MLFRCGLAVTARFLWECLNSRTVSRFPAPPLQTHRADFQQWAYLFASDQGLCNRFSWLDFQR